MPTLMLDQQENIFNNIIEIFSVMAFPLPEQKRERAYYVFSMLQRDNLNRRYHGRQVPPLPLTFEMEDFMANAPSWEQLGKDATKDLLEKCIAGYMLDTVRSFVVEGDETAGTTRAAYHIRRAFERGEFPLKTDRKPHEKDIFNAWFKYKSISHLFQAFLVFGGARFHNDNQSAPFGLHNFFNDGVFYFDIKDCLDYFINAAIESCIFGLAYKPPRRSKPLLDTNETWLPPEGYPHFLVYEFLEVLRNNPGVPKEFWEITQLMEQLAERHRRKVLDDGEDYLARERAKRKDGNYR